MADNYLERQREQYESRKAAWERAKKLGKKKATTKTRLTPVQKTESNYPKDVE